MEIREIQLYNYRVYYGKHIIRIPARECENAGNKSSSLTVIIGRNGSGKSVIVDGIFFALFGVDRRRSLQEPDYKSLINRHAHETGKKKCFIGLKLKIGREVFTFKRSIYPSNNMKVTVTTQGKERPYSELLEALEKVINLETAKYLFPNFRTHMDDDNGVISKKAIDTFLGLDILHNAKMNISEYNKKNIEFLTKNSSSRDLSHLKKRIYLLKVKKNKLKIRRRQLRDSLDHQKDCIRSLMRTTKKVKGLQKMLGIQERLQKRIYKLKKEISKSNFILTERYEMEPYFLIKSNIDAALTWAKKKEKECNELRRNTGKLEAQQELITSFFEPGISSGRCSVCNNRIKQTPDVMHGMEELKTELQTEIFENEREFKRMKLPPEINLQEISDLTLILNRYIADIEKAMDNRQIKIAKLNKLQTSLEELVIRYPTLLKFAEDDETKNRYQSLLNDISIERRRMHKVKMELHGMEEVISSIGEEIEETYAEFEKLSRSTRASTDRHLRKIKMARKIKKAISESILDVRNENRENIESGLNRILSGIFSKKGIIEKVIMRKGDQSLAIKVESPDNLLVYPSEFSDGEKVLVFMALIWSLNRLRGNTTIIYDSPFIHLDRLNKKSMINTLAKLPGQQVILTTEDDIENIRTTILKNSHGLYEIDFQESIKSSRLIPKTKRIRKKVKKLRNSNKSVENQNYKSRGEQRSKGGDLNRKKKTGKTENEGSFEIIDESYGTDDGRINDNEDKRGNKVDPNGSSDDGEIQWVI